MSACNETTTKGARLACVMAMVILGAAVAVALWMWRVELAAMGTHVMERARAAGPGFYFAGMALAPLPLAWFTVPAGELFAERLGLAGVIVAAMTAVVVQLSLGYAVARYGVRPWLHAWVTRRGYAVPTVTRENAASVVMMVRLLPGPPMILGSSLLAIAETPFAIYLALSALVALPWVCAGVILGRGIFDGNFGLVATGAGLLAAVVIGVRMYRARRERITIN